MIKTKETILFGDLGIGLAFTIAGVPDAYFLQLDEGYRSHPELHGFKTAVGIYEDSFSQYPLLFDVGTVDEIEILDQPAEEIARFRFPQDEHLQPMLGDLIHFKNASQGKPFYFGNVSNENPCFKMAHSPYCSSDRSRRQLNTVVINPTGRSTLISLLPEDWVREAIS